MIILNISKKTINHFLLVLSIIYPVNKEINSPGIVADAIIFPNVYSEPVSASTNQLIAIILNPKPISDIILPRKK